jgi:CRP-like cAMP-binding protein
MAVMIEKMVMTGAMCVVAQGSSVQLLIAILIMQFYMLLVLKTAPYEADSEDWTAFIACVALTLTTIGGFALIMDDPTQRTYESTVLTIVLIGINAVCFTLDILIVVVFDCGTYERCTSGAKAPQNGSDHNLTQVMPEHNIISIADTIEMHEEEIDQMHKDHIEHDKRFKKKHEMLRKRKTDRVQERLQVRTALRHSKTLQKTKIFHDLSSDVISKIINVMEYRTFDTLQNLVTQGEDASEFMVIMKGSATVFRDGNEIRRFESLDFLGEGALVEGDHTRGATVTANSSTQVLVLSDERYQELLMDGTIEQKTQEMVKRMSQSYTMEDAKRVKEALAESDIERTATKA